MKQIVKTAEKIMKETKEYTGWDLVGAVKGNSCSIRADLGKQMKVFLAIKDADVLIQVIGLGGKFDDKSIEMVREKLEFSVETLIEDDDSLTLSYHEPLGVLEHSVKGVLKECIMPMVELVKGMIEE